VLLALRYWLVRFSVQAATYLHWYRVKSYVYRWLFERKYRDVPLLRFTNLNELVAFIRPGLWMPDGWRSGWDATGYPGKAQTLFEAAQEVALGLRKPFSYTDFDCDEFAIFIAAALAQHARENPRAEIYDASVMAVTWAEGRTVEGHNVCLYRRPEGFYWVDYSVPHGPFLSVETAARDVAAFHGGPGETPLVYCRHDVNLRPIDAVTL